MGAGIKIVLTTSEGSIIEQSFTLGFLASNNEAAYGAVLAELRMAITLGITWLEVQCDSSLVVNQVSGEYHKGCLDGRVPTIGPRAEIQTP